MLGSIALVAGEDEAETPTEDVKAPAEEGQQQQEQPPPRPGFGERGRMRRRARFLRRARELAYRDLGGLVFDLHRFGQRNDPVVLAKLSTLGRIHSELRAIEQALREFRPVTVLREVGIGACPRCAALHGSEDRFCPGCGMAFDAGAERPLSTTPMAPAPSPRPLPASATAALTSAAPMAASASALAGAGGSLASTSGAAPASAKPAGAPASPKPGDGPAQLAVQSRSPADPLRAEPLTELVRPGDPSPQGTPPVKPTAAPVAARPEVPSAEPASEAGGDRGERDPDEAPTQIVRPSSDGA
jgi:hypothetical protein